MNIKFTQIDKIYNRIKTPKNLFIVLNKIKKI